MLPTLSKLLEKMFLSKVIFPLISHRVSHSQYAYIPRPGSGTTSALISVYHEILKFLDTAPGAVRFLSTDFSKAFDKLPHHVIISSCRKFSLPESVVGFVSSFLNQRWQRVSVMNKVSDWVLVTSGVPQGSVLGPILFCLAIDVLTPVCDNSLIVKYADDISILHFVREGAQDNLQKEWDNLTSWSNSMHLPMNLDKCCVLDFVTKRSLSLSLQTVKTSPTQSLKHVDSLSFLGVRFSSCLKWNSHVNFVIKKACKRIFMIRNLRRSGVSPAYMWKMYIALIRPVLLYAFPCFCNAANYLTKNLLRVENRVRRIINEDSVCVPSLLDAGNISCERLFNFISNTPSHPLRELFITSVPTRNTRTAKTLRRPFAKTKRFGNSFIKYCK